MVFRIILLFQHTREKYALTVFGSFWLVSVPKVRIRKKGIQVYCMLFWWCGVFIRKLDLKKQLNWKVCILDLMKNGKSWKRKKKKKSILRVWPKCGSVGETALPINSESSPCLFWSLCLSPGERSLTWWFYTLPQGKVRKSGLTCCSPNSFSLNYSIYQVAIFLK